jgi:peptide/nickel transport system permease protein
MSATLAMPGATWAERPVGRRVRAVGKLLGSVLATLFGLLVLTFVIGRLLPTDPVIAVLGDDYDPAAYERVYEELGLDKPLHVQFAVYAGNVLQGDFGNAVLTGRPVVEDIARVLPATIELATAAILIAVCLGVPLGVLAAVYRNRLLDHIVRVVTLLGFSAPIFWLALMGLVIFYAHLGWVGGSGRQSVYFLDLVPAVTSLLLVDALIAGDYEVFWDAVRHIALPASILGYASMAYIARMTRSFMLEQLGQEYILTARIKGAGPRRVVWLHAFKNIRVQLLTITALTYGGLVDGAVLVETTLLIGCMFIALNLLCDVLYRVFDPRTR